MFFLLVVATETVGSQYLQRAEEHEEAQPFHKMSCGRHLGVVFQ